MLKKGCLSLSEQKQLNGIWIIDFQVGRATKKSASLTEGTIWTAIFRYEDDERGNWIRQTGIVLPPSGQMFAGTERRRVHRIVEYYP